MSDLRVGGTVELTVKGEVVCKYESGDVKVRWDSGELKLSTSDARLEGN